MSPEQFNALTIMIQQMVYCEAARRDYMHASSEDTARLLDRARDASINSGKAIEQARALLVEAPGETQNLCAHGMLEWKCYVQGCKHYYRSPRI